MTRKSNAGQRRNISHSNADRSDVGFQELEARLLLSASGLTAYDPIGMIDSHDDHGIYQGIETPGDDHGNDAAGSTFVQTDTTIFGDIEEIADQDWFSFQSQTGIQYTFETGLFSLNDTSLTLYDTDGTTPLAFDDDGGTGLASLLTWTAPSQGTYYIAVRGFDIERGAYSISMSDTAVPTGEISGTKWDDINMDDIRDLDEPGLEGWVIFIDDNRNRRREPGERFEITDENGDYTFQNMRPGTYTIAERPKPGWEQTFPGEDGASTSTDPPEGIVVVPDSTPIDSSDGSVNPIDFSTIGKWAQPGGIGSTVTLTYSYSNLLDGLLPGGLSVTDIRQGIEEALNLWASFAPFKFIEVTDSGPLPGDIDTQYSPAGHPDIRFGHHFIDGDIGQNTLAHAFGPASTGIAGDVHFDNSNTWSIGPQAGATDLIEVAVHEIGHALGLGHEPLPIFGGEDAIMNPFYGRRYSGFETSFLLDDDIEGIQFLYGEVQSLLGIWTVTLDNPGDIATDIDFGSFLNDDHGSDAGSASPIEGNFISGNIESLGDVDWFSFEAGQGQRFAFETLLDDLESGDIEDTVIRLIDQDGVVLIGDDDDSGVKLASKFPWIAPAQGTYYLEVSGFRANIGEYTLRLGASPVGDLDGDGFVGVSDLQIVLAFWNQNVTAGELLQGDPTFDGFVGIDDLNTVLGNWNAGNQPPVASQQASNTQQESTAAATETTTLQAESNDEPAVQATEPVAPVRQARAQRSASATAKIDRSDRTNDHRSAIAAWSRKPVRMDSTPPYVSPATLADPDDSEEGLLGLWSINKKA